MMGEKLMARSCRDVNRKADAGMKSTKMSKNAETGVTKS